MERDELYAYLKNRHADILEELETDGWKDSDSSISVVKGQFFEIGYLYEKVSHDLSCEQRNEIEKLKNTIWHEHLTLLEKM